MGRNPSVNRITRQRANEIIDAMHGRKIVVLGDVMLDEFVWGDVTRISPEAPVPVVDIRRESVRLGGAANVVANLVALGARASLVGVIGNDRAGERLQTELGAVGGARADARLVTDEERATTIKTRIIAHNQLVVRADRERRTPVAAQIEAELIAALERALENADALVISDYDKGVVTPRAPAAALPRAAAGH